MQSIRRANAPDWRTDVNMTAAFSSYHTSNERFQHTGQVWLPGLGLYHYKAHSYSPTLERLLQPDPIGYADGMHMYAHVRNDPVNYTDPSGLRGFSRQSSCVTVGYVVSYGGTSEVRANLVCPEVTLDDERRNPGLIERIGDGGGRPPPGPPKPQKQCQRMDARSARGTEFGGAPSEWAGNASNALAVAAAVPTPATPVLAGLALLGRGLSLAGTGIQLAADYGHAQRTGDYARLKADAAGALVGAVSPGELASRATRLGASAAADNFGQKATDGVVGAALGSFMPEGC